MSIQVFECSHIGVAGTTQIHVRLREDCFHEARMGVAIMGATNMDEAGFEACNSDPFHELFHDNYVSGVGPTEEEAMAAMKKDMDEMAETLWF